jgi:hypothetical protein
VKLGWAAITGIAISSGLEAQPEINVANTIQTMTWLQYERIGTIMAGCV